MILNPYAIYAEFLDNFLIVIQNEDEKNNATLVSGFLRARILNSTISADNSAVPLSAVIKSNLVDKQGNFATSQHCEQAKRVIFLFDHARTRTQLERIGIDCSQLTEMQQIVLVTAFQEAINRIISGSLKKCVANLQYLSNVEHQELIRSILKEMDVTALKHLAKTIQFTNGSLTLTTESLVLLNRQRLLFSQMSTADTNVTISDEEFIAPEDPEPALLSLSQQVLLLDELVPTLALDPCLLSHEEELEHQAKLRLLQLYATILAMTKNNSWQVKAQWLRAGDSIQVGSQDIALPGSVSEIINIISGELSKKHKANYKSALLRVQTVAATYEQDWYTWTRNKLPYFCASASLKELLEEVLKIHVEGIPQMQPQNHSSVVSKMLHYGLGLWSSEEKDKHVGAASASPPAVQGDFR